MTRRSWPVRPTCCVVFACAASVLRFPKSNSMLLRSLAAPLRLQQCLDAPNESTETKPRQGILRRASKCVCVCAV